MTQNQKIILGVGAIALAYWLYTKKGKGSGTSSIPPMINDFPTIPNPNPKNLDRQIQCEKFLVEKLKTMRPDDLQTFKNNFMSDCLSEGSIKYDACRDKQANVRYATPLAYSYAIGGCMGCKKGEIYDLNPSNGKTMCFTPPYKQSGLDYSNFTSKSTRQSCARMYCVKDCIDTPRGGRCTI